MGSWEEHTHRMWLVLILGFCLLSASTGHPTSRKGSSKGIPAEETSIDEEKIEQKEEEHGGEGDGGDEGEDNEEEEPGNEEAGDKENGDDSVGKMDTESPVEDEKNSSGEEPEGPAYAHKEGGSELDDIKFKVDITNKEEAGEIVEHVITSLKSLNNWLQELVQYWDRIVEAKSGIEESGPDTRKDEEAAKGEVENNSEDKADDEENADAEKYPDTEEDRNADAEKEVDQLKEVKEDEAVDGDKEAVEDKEGAADEDHEAEKDEDKDAEGEEKPEEGGKGGDGGSEPKSSRVMGRDKHLNSMFDINMNYDGLDLW